MCDMFPQKFDVQTSYKPSNYVLGPIFAVKIKFPRATYHIIVPSTEELYCLNNGHFLLFSHGESYRLLDAVFHLKRRNLYYDTEA